MHERRDFQLTADTSICRLLNGMWQVSGAHGVIDPGAALDSMLAYHDAGFTTWDLADHYGPAEDFIGEFRRRLAASHEEAALQQIQAFSKWVPQPGPMSRRLVEDSIDTSLRRMDVERLDMLQFHWWDYQDGAFLNALDYLTELQEEGKIRHLGLTNFDTTNLERIVRHGIPIVSNQVQYSLVDLRPEVRMAGFCQEQGISLLTYGTLCGGLLSEKYLGQPEPARAELDTVSLRKYKQMVDTWGGWGLFQELLSALRDIAGERNASIANVAVRAILDRPAVAGVIVGVRLGIVEHRSDNAGAFEVSLTDQDRGRIESVTSRSNDLYAAIGDCGDEYRR